MARILLVDDDKDIRDFGCALLAKAGHAPFAVDSVVAALEYLRDHSVDLVLTDANMPQHTGFDLLRTMKRDEKLAKIKVAMLTGRRERKDIERAIELGVHDYIVKPIDPMKFVTKVSDLLGVEAPDSDEIIEIVPEENLTQLKVFISAQVVVGVDIVSLSEAELVLRSPHRFETGTRIELGTDLFARIGIEIPDLRVAKVEEPDVEGFCATHLEFLGMDERALAKIRAFVTSNTGRTPRSGKVAA